MVASRSSAAFALEWPASDHPPQRPSLVANTIQTAQNVPQARYDYDPFGRATKLSGSLASDFQYAGMYMHQTSGLYLTPIGNTYDPNTGRWIGRDPLGEEASLNLYSYVRNDPINMVDPLGLYGENAAPINPIDPRTGKPADPNYMDPQTLAAAHAIDVYLDVLSFVPGPSAEAGAVCKIGKVFSKGKQALVDMAKLDKKTGMTPADMQAYKDLNKELPDPFPANKVRADPAHPSGAPTSQQPHGHVGPVDHIPIK